MALLDSGGLPRDIRAMISTVSLVALGGAIGAALRYLSGLGVLRLFGHGDFPVAIITVNVIGSFLMGVFVVAAAQKGLTHLSPLVMTGLLGGFTTFSAFSLETMTLIERGATGQAALYILLSVGLSVGALALGLMMARGVFA
ncbi:fluoride efflux transporter CrcB [Microbulbifer sp. S227A]|uniref:fluoride efflux transporter CrcB n=1 Tax=Microbulbifer sp. S227A TaxID=3415131 RepID=UPI003C7CFFD6